VKLLRLYALNFKKLKFNRALEFREGVTLISGLNEAGKSSILDAILYALFGRVVRPPGATKDDIIAYGASEAQVWLEFEVEGRRYRVERRIHRKKPSKAHLYEVLPGEQLKPLATEVRRVTEAVEGLLGGITFDEIVSSTVVAQKDLGRLVQQRGDDRRKVINVFLNLESFNTVLDSLSEERKELEGTGPARPGRINLERERLEALQRELQEFRSKEQEVNALTRENDHLAAELEALQKRYEETSSLHQLLASHDEALRRKAEVEGQLQLKRQTLREYREQVAGLENRIREVTEQMESYRGLDEAEPNLRELAERIEEIRALEPRMRELEARRDRLESETSALKGQLQGLTPQRLEGLMRSRQKIGPLAIGSTATLALAALTSLTNTLLALILGAIGGALLALLAIHVARMARLTQLQELMGSYQLLEAKGRELEDLKGQLQRLRQQRAEAERQLQDTCAQLTRYTHIYQVHIQAPLEAAEAVLAEAEKELKKLDELSTTLNTLREELERVKAREDVPALEAEIQSLEAQLSSITPPPLPEGIEFSRELLKEKADEKEQLAREVTARKTRMERNREVIERDRRFLSEHADIERRVEEQARLVQDIERRIRVVRRAIEGIEKTAEALRNRVKPAVENYMGHILPTITAGRYRAVLLDEDYNLQVWDPEAGGFRAKEVFSGGTEDQFLLAMRLAFALALLPEVKGRKPEFLFLDEPLGSSDEIRRSGILEYLRSGLAGNFRQIFLISHLTGLDEVADSIIRLEDGTPL